MVRKSKEHYCSQHPNQVLWFYCNRCEIPVCRDCTVMEHPTASHGLVKLDEATVDLRKDIEKWVKTCKVAKNEVDEALGEALEMKLILGSRLAAMYDAIDVSTRKLKDKVKKEESDLKKTVSDTISAREKAVSAHEDDLQLLSSRLNTALQMAGQLSSEESDYVVASSYKSLRSSLIRLARMKTPVVQIGEIKFVEQPKPKTTSLIGRVTGHPLTRRDRWISAHRWNKTKWGEPWKMVMKLGDAKGEGKLKDARGVAINDDGDIVVTDVDCERLYVYGSQDGKVKKVYNTEFLFNDDYQEGKSFPNSIVIWKGLYLISDQSIYLKYYNTDGYFVKRSPKFPNKISAICLGPNRDSQLLVGLVYTTTIVVYNLDTNSEESRIDVGLSFTPYFLALSADDRKIVGTDSLHCAIIDLKDSSVCMVTPPKDVISFWAPRGIGIIGEGEDEEIFVCSSGFRVSPKGVHRFSLATKAYVSCVNTKDLKSPVDIAFTADGKIVVTDTDSVKVFAPSNLTSD